MLWLCVVACGCGDNSLPPLALSPDNARSGARLQITFWDFEDGVRVWTLPHPQIKGVSLEEALSESYRDAKRGETCTVREWTDGNTYCTPEYATLPSFNVAFAHATCSKHLARSIHTRRSRRRMPLGLQATATSMSVTAPEDHRHATKPCGVLVGGDVSDRAHFGKVGASASFGCYRSIHLARGPPYTPRSGDEPSGSGASG